MEIARLNFTNPLTVLTCNLTLNYNTADKIRAVVIKQAVLLMNLYGGGK
ncbi:MAG: hypothetical protein HW384_2052 [Dehalococcoidia bacterium]|nr:hypothetical protein [Dehalococcoidia bacterium]MBF8304329.1 hypothetical protein [Dehalococcoidia bacterium]